MRPASKIMFYVNDQLIHQGGEVLANYCTALAVLDHDGETVFIYALQPGQYAKILDYEGVKTIKVNS
jgi:hypothetical protein